MNSKLWIRRSLTTGLMVAVFATYSMMALAGDVKASGELSVSGSTADAAVTVNGESARSGRTVFTSSTIVTLENTVATINMGTAGEIQLAPNSSVTVNFDSKNISADVSAGSITVLRSAAPVAVTTAAGKSTLGSGDSSAAAPDDYRDSNGKCIDADNDGKLECDKGAAWWLFALVTGGAVAGIIWATSQGNDISLGGGGTVVSPVR